MSNSPREIELKLELDPAAQDKLRRSGRVDGFGATRAVTESLRSIYFDTADQALRKARISLRVRKSGQGWVQTAKLGTGVTGGLSSPVEAEHPVQGRALDLSEIADTQVRDALTQVIGDADVSERFQTIITRTTRQLTRAADGTRIELAFDTGHIQAGPDSRPLAELEMELKSGPRAALFEAAKHLLGNVPFRFSPFSKAERGYRLTEGTHDEKNTAFYAGPIVLDPGITVEQAFLDVLRSCLVQIAENRLAVLASEDPEGPHQLRIGLRRLRSAFKLFRPVLNPATTAPLDQMARRIAGKAGALRDFDVLIGDIVQPLARTAPEALSFEALLSVLQDKRRQTARAPSAAELTSAAVNGFLLDLAAYTECRGWRDPDSADQGRLLAQPVKTFAASTLSRRWKKVDKYGKRINELTICERHEMRKAMKSLRYGIEFFASLFPDKKVKPLLKRMKRLQDLFGALNDVALTTRLAELSIASSPDAVACAQAAGFTIGWHEAHGQAKWRHAKKYWKATRDVPKFWT